MRLALALSGGGLRATYFHLGVVRFLSDAGLLQDVTDIASVSGGSILAAHMLTDWEQYTGDDKSFQKAAGDILEFGQRDIRGQILRRLPLCLFAKLMPFYKQSRSLLLEHYYSKYLYKDARLAALSEDGPWLHIMTTNLSTGESCSFNRSGLTVDSPRKEIKGSELKLSQAVACSSAFPGFFPPIPISADDLGTDKKRWSPDPQRFTDGGVFDNLGLRKLKLINESAYNEIYFQDTTIASWVDLCGRIHAKREETATPEAAVYRTLSFRGRELVSHVADRREADVEVSELVDEFNTLLKKSDFYDEERWKDVQLQATLGQILTLDQAKLTPREIAVRNRGLLESAFPESFRVGDIPFNLVLLSDAGAPFDWETRRFEGPLSTALRAINLLMNRIHKLERGHGFDKEHCLELRIDDDEMVDQDDPKLNASVRKRLPRIRTDLDRFTPDEIRALVMHGYCVARDRIREVPALSEEVASEVFERPPWDPFPNTQVDLSDPSAGDRFRLSQSIKIQPKTIATYAMPAILICAALWLGWSSGWFERTWSQLFDRSSIHVRREVVYARFSKFVDRETQTDQGEHLKVGQKSSTLAEQTRMVFDQADYIMAFYLEPHRVKEMALQATSSGVVAATPIIPESLEAHIEEYHRLDGHELDYKVPLMIEGGGYVDYVLHTLSFYNGYQFNRKRKTDEIEGIWESDGGVHIQYPTDEFVLIFDFRFIDHERTLASDPVLKVNRDGAGLVAVLGSHYRGGVLHSPVIRNLQPNDEVHVLWKWSVEE